MALMPICAGIPARNSIAGFMSKKFTNAQQLYFMYEHETLGVIQALKKWDDILLGLPEIRIVTDHKALKTSCKNHMPDCTKSIGHNG
jgi:hypothetical protein